MSNTAKTVPNIKLDRTALRAAAQFGVVRAREPTHWFEGPEEPQIHPLPHHQKDS